MIEGRLLNHTMAYRMSEHTATCAVSNAIAELFE
jgi:hypothetical protein